MRNLQLSFYKFCNECNDQHIDNQRLITVWDDSDFDKNCDSIIYNGIQGD